MRRRLALAAVALLLIAAASIGAFAVGAEKDTPGYRIVEALRYPIRQNEGLHYNIHMALGKAFSLCPCTAGLSRSQYGKAYLYRPHDESSPQR